MNDNTGTLLLLLVAWTVFAAIAAAVFGAWLGHNEGDDE
jgi:hypothetical protein